MVNGELLMRRQLIVFSILFSLMALLAACGEAPNAAPTAVGENGIPIASEFQDFYQDFGGRAILGEPVTEMFTTVPGERPLQYFQNLRLEYDALNGNVLVSQLGTWELGGLNEQIAAPVPEDGAIRTFPNSEFTVQDEFLRFYEEQAGDVLLGLPISAQLNVDGLRVQYFENGRLEWHPEAPADQRVQLGNLGQTHFDNEMVFAYQEMRPAQPISSAGVTDVDISAYVKAPITNVPFLKGNELNYIDVIAFLGDNAVSLIWVFFIPLVIFVVTAVSNAANLTDGIDGLAAGVSAIIGAVLAIFAYVSSNSIFADYLNILFIPNAEEMVIYSACFLGGCIGFLWFNAYPAKIFMGDTGSLMLGGVIAAMAIMLRKELLIPILCGIFLLENLSVIIQVSYFKYTKKKSGEGKRIFLMSPLHHHYQKKGIHESKIVTRFWIVGIMLAVITVMTLKIR